MDESKHFNIDIALDLGLSYDSDIPYTFRLNGNVRKTNGPAGTLPAANA